MNVSEKTDKDFSHLKFLKDVVNNFFFANEQNYIAFAEIIVVCRKKNGSRPPSIGYEQAKQNAALSNGGDGVIQSV